MLSSQHLLIILILSNVATIVFIIFDAQKMFPIFLLRFHNSESETSSAMFWWNGGFFHRETEYFENATILSEEGRSNFLRLSVEERWRHVLSTVRNMWLFLHHRFSLLKKQKLPRRAKRIVNYLDESGVEYYRVLWFEISQQLNLEEWQERKRRLAASLEETVQERIDKLQNPSDCQQSKAYLCNLTNIHGLASSLHDVLWCFVKAYHENALLLLDTSRWHYEIGSWKNAFLPVSRRCTKENSAYHKNVSLPGKNDAQARFELTLLPEDLAASIVTVIDQPFAWWYGQFMKYMMRPSQQFSSYLVSKKEEIGFAHPIIGIHVRRTDKIGKEAKHHDLEEYMYYVEDYYLRLELAGEKQTRRVFIASDEPNVLKECRERFQRYVCLGFPENALLASNLTSRYSENSLWGVLVELALLAECEFLVCTFSSGFCRIAYELMHATDPDASNRVHSLDVEYFYAWQRAPDRIALYDHIPKVPQELDLHRNDVLRKKDEFSVGYEALEGKVMDGIAAGVTSGTSKSGFYPLFKTVEYYRFKKETIAK